VSTRELALAVAGSLVALVSAIVSLWPPARPSSDLERPAVARVSESSGEVKRRAAETLGWQRLVKGMGVLDADAVFVPPGAHSALKFDDGTELFLEERSLVVVEHASWGRRLRLRQGVMSGRIGSQPISVETPAGPTTLEAASEVRVELSDAGAEVAVSKGSAVLGGSRPVEAGQRATAGRAGIELLRPWPVQLVAPGPRARRTFTGTPGPVELEWTGALPKGARVQLAHDRLFAFVARDVGVEGTTLTIEVPAVGINWWRVVDERRLPISEARRFVEVEDVPPVSMKPTEAEVVLGPPGTPVAFAWTPLLGVEHYRLEVAGSETFDSLALVLDSTTAAARVDLGLSEGVWHWRVRSMDDEAPGLPSKSSRFRLIHRAIPEAPELLKPEIEVGQ
jgi:hypothetical protein